MAEAIGIHGIRIEDPTKLEHAMRGALAHDRPFFLDGVTAKQELAVPPKIQFAQAKGFSLYMLKAIINGRGNEAIELAKTNLRR